jgi:hypothetical protein
MNFGCELDCRTVPDVYRDAVKEWGNVPLVVPIGLIIHIDTRSHQFNNIFFFKKSEDYVVSSN